MFGIYVHVFFCMMCCGTYHFTLCTVDIALVEYFLLLMLGAILGGCHSPLSLASAVLAKTWRRSIERVGNVAFKFWRKGCPSKFRAKCWREGKSVVLEYGREGCWEEEQDVGEKCRGEVSWRSEGFSKKWRWGKCCRVVLEGGVLQRNGKSAGEKCRRKVCKRVLDCTVLAPVLGLSQSWWRRSYEVWFPTLRYTILRYNTSLSDALLQQFPTALLSYTPLQHFSPTRAHNTLRHFFETLHCNTLTFSNTSITLPRTTPSLQHTTHFSNTPLQHFFPTFLYNIRIPMFSCNTSLQHSSWTRLHTGAGQPWQTVDPRIYGLDFFFHLEKQRCFQYITRTNQKTPKYWGVSCSLNWISLACTKTQLPVNRPCKAKQAMNIRQISWRVQTLEQKIEKSWLNTTRDN